MTASGATSKIVETRLVKSTVPEGTAEADRRPASNKQLALGADRQVDAEGLGLVDDEGGATAEAVDQDLSLEGAFGGVREGGAEEERRLRLTEAEISASGGAGDGDDAGGVEGVDGRGSGATEGGADDADEARTFNQQAGGGDGDVGLDAAVILTDEVNGMAVDLVAVELFPAQDARDGEVGSFIAQRAGERAGIAQHDRLAGGNDDRRLRRAVDGDFRGGEDFGVGLGSEDLKQYE